MSIDRIRPLAAVLTFIVGMQGPALVSATAAEEYHLLRLGGTWVKWGEPALGTRAEVTYALATDAMEFPKARNCGSLVPIGPLLTRSGVPDDTFRKEMDFAFEEWSRVANITFRAVADATAADIVIGAQKHPRGRAYSNVAYSPRSQNGTRRISKSLICLNPDKGWKLGFDGNLEVYDLRYTLMHEIGHAIGLDHPGPHGQMMSFDYHEKFRRLQTGDVAGAAVLYGAAGSEVAPRPLQNVAGEAAGQSGDDIENARQTLSLGEK